MSWTRQDAAALMDGKYRLRWKSVYGGGTLPEAGTMDSFLEAQVEQSRWETYRRNIPGYVVFIERNGRILNEEGR
jgi:hypothetical protein